MDPKQIVAQGYDRIDERHSEWASRVRKEERAQYTSILLEELPEGAEVLELGCGVGIPTTRQLAQRFVVTGVDISARQIALARQNVPAAKFIHADMMELDLPPASFDAVVAFYSIIHVPRQEHPKLLQTIATWLRSGGLLVVTMGASSTDVGFEEDWLGAPMYWSSYGSETNKHLVEATGLHIISAREETAEEFGELVTFLWVVAQKPT
ncbi:MAG: class I SAM-dependent methyltransferase [Candidatus Bipolaricaulia bacterium]